MSPTETFLFRYRPEGTTFLVDFSSLPVCFGRTEAPFIHATIDNRVVGMIQPRTPYEEGTCAFSQLWVFEKLRKFGIGAQLVGEAARWARKKGAARLTGVVDDDNLEVLPFYKRLNFVESPADDGRILVTLPLVTS